jgi:lantibiotic biosynthesis protein
VWNLRGTASFSYLKFSMASATRGRNLLKGRGAYEAHDFVMLRAPLLPVENYLAIADTIGAIGAAPSMAPVEPQVRRALAIGSPSLLEALERASAGEKKAPQLIAKLRRFLIRMSTRPTPFGVFAGVALARWGGSTDVALDGNLRTQSRLGMDWLVQYVLALEEQPAIRNGLRWVANSALFFRYGRAMLSERVPPRRGPRGSVSIAATSVVRRAIELARAPILYRTLVESLVVAAPSATVEKVERILQGLWEHGFLRTELMPPVTVEDPSAWVRDRLASIPGAKAAQVQFDGLLRTVSACDLAPPELAPKAQRKAAAHINLLGSARSEMPLQVDMVLGLNGDRLTSRVGEEAARTAELLLRLTPVPDGPPNVVGYRQAFLARYGHDREVPLLELLDPEWGIGPADGQQGRGSGIDPQRAAQRSQTLQHLALSAIREGRLVVELDERTLDRLETSYWEAKALPASLDLNVFVLGVSPAAIDAGDFQLLVGPNLGAPEAGRNLGRFAYLLGPDARAALEQAARSDEARNPERITAEIAYLPRDFRAANVTVRPAVRRYEVNCGVSSGVDSDHVIPLNELVVGVREGRFYVRLLRKDVEILFASGHMLNPMQAPWECRLLCDISRDGIPQPSTFDWGPAAGYMFLPRVQSGRSILHPAQWRLEPFDRQGEVPAGPFGDWFARWRERWQVPRRVYLSWADNRLLYDLDDPAQVEDLRGELRRAGDPSQCLLQEPLPGPEHAWLRSADGGHHIAELVASLRLRGPPKTAAASRERRPSLAIPPEVRLRPPGSDWLYMKLYGSRAGQDELITGPLRELGREIGEQQIVHDWIFLRYADPELHLRLRFRGAPERLSGQLFPRLCTWASRLISLGLCQKFGFDTYEREVERYGGPDATTAAEALFAADSRSVVELLYCARSADRMLLTVASVDDLLAALGLNETARLAWLKQMIPSHKEVRLLKDEYRSRREPLVGALRDPARLGAHVHRVLAARRPPIVEVSRQLANIEAAGALTQPLSKLHSSYVHMHCNRLWIDQTAERRALGLLLLARTAIAHGAGGTNESVGSDALARDLSEDVPPEMAIVE